MKAKPKKKQNKKSGNVFKEAVTIDDYCRAIIKSAREKIKLYPRLKQLLEQQAKINENKTETKA
jgi:hypothetical protein